MPREKPALSPLCLSKVSPGQPKNETWACMVRGKPTVRGVDDGILCRPSDQKVTGNGCNADVTSPASSC